MERIWGTRSNEARRGGESREFDTPLQKIVVDIRNAIEHIDERISRGVEGPLSIKISDDALVAEVAGETVRLDHVAGEIRALHSKIFKFMNPDTSI